MIPHFSQQFSSFSFGLLKCMGIWLDFWSLFSKLTILKPGMSTGFWKSLCRPNYTHPWINWTCLSFCWPLHLAESFASWYFSSITLKRTIMSYCKENISLKNRIPLYQNEYALYIHTCHFISSRYKEKVSVSNLTSSWTDGLALNALLHSFK